MAAALTLLVLLAGSLLIVRIASVALRLTGLPDHVARFQSISALTGAGFTTTESESIVNFPIRRKVIVGLMIFGNLGLISVLSTFVVAFSESAEDTGALIQQGLMIIAVVAFIAFVMTNQTLDNILCKAISRILHPFLKSNQQHFLTVLALGNDYIVAEHVYRGKQDHPLPNIVPAALGLNILSVRGIDQTYFDEFEPQFLVAQNESLVCFGSNQNHQRLADHLSKTFPFQPGEGDTRPHPKPRPTSPRT